MKQFAKISGHAKTRGKALKKNQKNQLKSQEKIQKSKKFRTHFFKCFTPRAKTSGIKVECYYSFVVSRRSGISHFD